MDWAVEKLAQRTEGLVVNSRQTRASPNASNVVAGTASMTLDARHPHDAIRLGSVNELIEIAMRSPASRPGNCNARGRWINPSVSMDERLPEYLVDAMEAAGFPPKRMNSGAVMTPW